MAKEYVIWGIPKGEKDETLLLASVQGKKITDLSDAKKLVELLKKKYGATKMRIQEIDLDRDLDWMKEIGMNPKRKRKYRRTKSAKKKHARRRNPHDFEKQLLRNEKRRFAADDRWITKMDRLEAKAEKLIGHLRRNGKIVYYINLYPYEKGKIKIDTEAKLIAYLIRNRYVV